MTDEYYYRATLKEGNNSVAWDPATNAKSSPHKLIVKQFILGHEAAADEDNVVQIENMNIRVSAVLKAGQARKCRLNLELTDPPVTFTLVEGKGPVNIRGQHLLGSLVEDLEDMKVEFPKRTRFEDLVSPEPNAGHLTRRQTISAPGTSGTTRPLTVLMDTEEAATISNERLKIFKQGISQAFRQAREQSLPVARLAKYIDENSGAEAFSKGEVKAAIARMSDDNQIMMIDDIVFLI